MKLVHTADIHLDACFPMPSAPPGFGSRRRQGLREVFQRIVQRAIDWPADALLVAGDLFEQDRISRDTIAFLREMFELLRPIPVFIAPGNRDPYVPASPYATEAWPANVFIFSEPKWTAHPLQHLPLTIHGFAFDGAETSHNPFGELRPPEDGRIHVALGHGTELGQQDAVQQVCAPFDAAEAAAPGLHYLALGHCHGYQPIPGDYDTCICYCGAPEGHGFHEPGPRHYVEVDIQPGDGGPPRIELNPVMSAQCIYTAHTIDLAACGEAQQLLQMLRGLAGESSVRNITRVTLRGSGAPDVVRELPRIYDAVSEEFEFIDIVEMLEPLEDYELLGREQTSLGDFVQRMNEGVAAAPDTPRQQLLERAREVGVHAYRKRSLPIRGLRGSEA